MNAEYEEGLRRAAAYVCGRKIEHAVVVDAEGVEVWVGKGGRKSVPVPATRQRVAVVHNHPGDGPLSYQDVAIAWSTDNLEAIAVATDFVYRLIPLGVGRWPISRWQGAEIMEDWRKGKLDGHTACRQLAAVYPGQLTYLRLPTRAWFGGARFVAPRTGPATEVCA